MQKGILYAPLTNSLLNRVWNRRESGLCLQEQKHKNHSGSPLPIIDIGNQPPDSEMPFHSYIRYIYTLNEVREILSEVSILSRVHSVTDYSNS